MSMTTVNQYLEKGQQLQQAGQILEAIACYQKAIELNIEDAELYYNLGQVLIPFYRWDEAISAYQKAIDLKQMAKYYQKLGESFHAKDDIDAAIVAYLQAIKLNNDVERGNSSLVNLDNLYYNLAEALHRQGKYQEAIGYYRESLEINPQVATVHHHLGVALGSLCRWNEAVISYRTATKLAPTSFWSHLLLGEAWEEQKNLKEAIIAYQAAVQLQPSAKIYCKLGQLLLLDSRWDEARSAYETAIKLDPDNCIDAYPNLRDIMVKQNSLDEAILSYQQAVQIKPNSRDCFSLGKLLAQRNGSYEVGNLLDNQLSSYHQLGIILYQQGLVHEAVDCFKYLPKKQSRNSTYENIWKGLNQLGTLDVDHPDYQSLKSDHANLEISHTYFCQNSSYKVINIQSLNSDEEKFLEEAGLSLDCLKLIQSDNSLLQEIYMNSFAEVVASNDTSLDKSSDNQPRCYQEAIAKTGYIYTICPVSGRVVRSDQSFYVRHIPAGIYRFVGDELFYLIFGSHDAVKVGIYFPRLELIVNVDGRDHLDLDGIINEFKAFSVSCWREFKSYISNDRPKELVAIPGWLKNIGHYFCNDVAGIHSLIKNGNLANIDKFLIGDANFFNIADIFPEIDTKKVIHPLQGLSEVPSRLPMSKLVLFKTILENNYFAVRFTDVLITEELATVIYQAALKRCSPSFLATIEKAKNCFPLLWIQVRVTYRVWLSEIEGLVNIINSLYADFPNLGIVFVGNWYLREEDTPNKDAVIDEEKIAIDKIQTMIPNTISVYNLIGCPTYEHIVFGYAIDLYIQPIGSGFTFISHIANKTGVFHQHKAWGGSSYNMLASLRENCVLPVQINSFREEDPGDPMRSNYDCDWHPIYEESVKLIKKIAPRNNH